MRATAAQLRRVTGAMLVKGGSAEAEADLVADHLVQANLAGHDSHGIGMMPAYVRHLQAGLVVPNTRVKLVNDGGATLMFDGARGYGRPVAGEAMAAAPRPPESAAAEVPIRSDADEQALDDFFDDNGDFDDERRFGGRLRRRR